MDWSVGGLVGCWSGEVMGLVGWCVGGLVGWWIGVLVDWWVWWVGGLVDADNRLF